MCIGAVKLTKPLTTFVNGQIGGVNNFVKLHSFMGE